MIESNFLNNGGKGQVFVIIGLVMALSLFLIRMSADFEAAISERGERITDIEMKRLNNFDNEVRETYDIAAKQRNLDTNLLNKLKESTEFINNNLGVDQSLNVVFSFVTSDKDGSNITLLNMMGREISDVVIDNENCNILEHGEHCSVDAAALGSEVSISYFDAESDAEIERFFDVLNTDNFSSAFYRIEYQTTKGHYILENTAHSEQL